MEHLSKDLLAKVRAIKVESHLDLMPYFTTKERGHGEMDYVEFLMQNDGNPPEGGTWTEEHISYEQLKALYNFCKENGESHVNDYLKLISSMDENVLLSFPNVKKSVVKRELSSKVDRRTQESLKRNLRNRFFVNRPRFWMLESGDIICQPDRRKSQFFQCYENYYSDGYWFSETIMVGNTAIMVKCAL